MNRVEAMIALQDEKNFHRRITAEIVKQAVQVSREAVDFPNHARRASLAFNVLSNPEGMTPRFSWVVASDPTVTDAYMTGMSVLAVQQADIARTVGAMWDAIAGNA